MHTTGIESNDAYKDNALHRPWYKVAINSGLRFFQTRERPARLYAMYSIFGDQGAFLGYGFGRITHKRSPHS